MHTGISVSVVENASAFFDPGGNLDLERGFSLDGLFSATLRAGVFDDDASAVADGASPRDAEEALLVAHLAASVALSAGNGGFALGGASAATL